MSEMDSMDLDIVEMTDDEGNTILMQVIDYFFYNGDEYVILTDSVQQEEDEELDLEEIDCYVLRVVSSVDEETGEEMEEFQPIEDEKLEEKLIEIATSKLNEDEEPEA